jgi:hypothetical protein
VQFEGDFSIHLRTHYQSLLGGEDAYPVTRKAHWGELFLKRMSLKQFNNG